MKPAPLDYRRAESVDHAIELTSRCAGFAKYLAGGQTLGPMINLRLAQPDLVVDVSRLTELRQASDNGSLILLGAAVSHAEIEDGTVPDPASGLLAHVASNLAYRAIRNRGTLGGSLAHADPAAEWPCVMMALDASVVARGSGGARRIELRRFFHGPMTTDLAEDEIIVAVEIPRTGAGARWGYHKRARKVGEFAYALAAAIHDPRKEHSAVVLGVAAGVPLHLLQTSALCAETPVWREGFERELRRAYEEDIDDAGLELDEYDRHVHGLAVVRAVKDAAA